MKIIRLTAENVKRISAVEISPDGNLVVIGGRNGQGKTSTIDAIWYALGGKGAIPDEPLKHGKKKGRVEVNLGDIVVSRTFTKAGGGVLKVMSADGKSFPSPQKMLDDLVGRLSFDPLEFSRMKPKEQLETLKGITGVDFSELNEERQELYDERTTVNRDVKRLEARMEAIDVPENVPDEEVSSKDIVDEISAGSKINEENDRIRATYEKHRDASIDIATDIKDVEREIKKLQDELLELKKKSEDTERLAQEFKSKVETLEDVDLGELRNKLLSVEETNRKVRKNQEYKKLSRELGKAIATSEKLTEKIWEIDTKKEELVAEAEMPLEGLGFGEGVVTFNGVPFNQASGAEQLRVSVAIGMALNPKLRVLLVRDGSLLDHDSMKLLAEMADKNNTQIWIERVGDGDEVTVVIEDGQVRENEE